MEELNIELNYWNIIFNELDIIALEEGFVQHINTLIMHLKNKDQIHFNPSDFDHENLDVLFG